VAAVAAQLGTLLAYSEVDLTTPRQSGKTTLELAVLVHRCRTWARSRALYSAQSRIHAHKKWEAAGVEVVKPTTKARAAADSGFYDAVTDSRSLRYVPRPALDAAVAGAATRPLGDSWAWPGRACRSISARWSRCPWPAGAMPPGPTSTTAGPASTSESVTAPEASPPRGRDPDQAG
jgi:hypothetical protein